MNTPVRVGETIEGSRTTRNRPYPVLKCSLLRVAGHASRTDRGLARLGVTNQADFDWWLRWLPPPGHASFELNLVTRVGEEELRATNRPPKTVTLQSHYRRWVDW